MSSSVQMIQFGARDASCFWTSPFAMIGTDGVK